MVQRVFIISVAVVLFAISGCKKEEKLACVDVATAVKKWAEVSFNGGSAELSRSILETCSAGDWSQTRKKCVIDAFGEAEPMEGMIVCETGSKAAAKDYIAKSKTQEAQQFLKKMSDAARTYYQTPAIADVTSLAPSAVAKQFPVAIGPTPPLGSCCENGGKCDPSDGDWEAPTWLALDFAFKDPHFYSYEFATETSNGEPMYTAIAYGDLDCDGTYSTFTLYGMAVDGEVQSSDDVIKVDPLE